MPNYSYKVRSESGKLVSGNMSAPNKDKVADELRRSNYTVISIDESVAAFDEFDRFLRHLTRIKVNDLVMFNVQLSNMVGAGIPLPTALLSLSEQIENARLRDAVSQIYNDIKSGSTFSDALAKFPDIFPSIFINMTRAGEVAGNLDEVLTRLAQFLEREADLNAKISSAMFYPIILAVFGTAVIILITVMVLPSFAKIFMDANVPLPLPTMVLYKANLIIRAYWEYVLAVIAVVYILLRWFKRTPTGKFIIDRITISIPVWGKLSREVAIARLCKTLASLISSGVPMLQSLEVTEQTVDNAILARVLRRVYSSVSKGDTISTPLKESGEFPPMTVHMIAVGEETGALDTMLNKVADFYDMSAEYSIKKLTALIEPLFLVVLGSGVAFIFSSILLPIFNMVKTMKTM